MHVSAGEGVSSLEAGLLKASCGDGQQRVGKQMNCDSQLEQRPHQPVSLRLSSLQEAIMSSSRDQPGNMTPP